MRNHLRAVQLLCLFAFFLIVKAEGQTIFQNLRIESMGLDTLYRPYDSDNPKAKLRVINQAGTNSPAGIQVSVACPEAPNAGGGLAIFPNGGPIVVLAPNETTYVSSWLRGLWESGTQITNTIVTRNIVFTFSYQATSATHTRTVYIATQDQSQPPPGGSITISGVIRLPAGSPGPANAWLGTAFWLQAPLTLTPSAGTFTFSTSINPQFARNRTWYIRMAAGGARDTLVRLNLTSSVSLDVKIGRAHV